MRYKISISLTLFVSIFSSSFSQVVKSDEIGLDPRGAKDNSLLLNKVIDSLSAKGGGTLLISNGNYRLDDAVILQSNIILRGQSQKGTVFFRKSETGNWSNTKNQALITTNPSQFNENIIVQNLRVNGNFNKKEVGAKGGICLRNCTNSTIQGVTTENTWHGVAFYGFKGDNSQNLVDSVSSINAHSFTTQGNSGRPRGILTTDAGSCVRNSKSIGAGTGFYANGRNITFQNNYAEFWFEDNGFYLIVDNLLVSNCYAKGGETPEQGFGSGFAIAYKKGGLIENSTAINCSNYGFRIHVPQSDTQFINNEANGCGNGFGIEIASHPFPEVSDNLLLQNNTSKNSGLHGFLFRQMSNSAIVNNKAINGNQSGVTLSTRGAIALKEYLANNRFEGNECIDTQSKKTQIYGIYDFSVKHISSEAKKGKNNKIKHQSKNGIDEF